MQRDLNALWNKKSTLYGIIVNGGGFPVKIYEFGGAISPPPKDVRENREALERRKACAENCKNSAVQSKTSYNEER